MLISCGVDNKFVLLQNILIDHVSTTKLILNRSLFNSWGIVFLWGMFRQVVYGN
jgi:hypothetical protein